VPSSLYRNYAGMSHKSNREEPVALNSRSFLRRTPPASLSATLFYNNGPIFPRSSHSRTLIAAPQSYSSRSSSSQNSTVVSYFTTTVSPQSSAPTTPAPSEYCAKPDPHDLIDQVPWQRANEVLPGLFVGGLDAARSLRFLRDKRIGAVLSICTDFVPAEDRMLGLWHLRLAVPEEGGDMLVALPRAVAFIEQARAARRAVLVHSTRGQSRAPAVIAAYCACVLARALGATLTRTRSDASAQARRDRGAAARAHRARARVGRPRAARAARALPAVPFRPGPGRACLRRLARANARSRLALSRDTSVTVALRAARTPEYGAAPTFRATARHHKICSK
jgi:hypothetical protein